MKDANELITQRIAVLKTQMDNEQLPTNVQAIKFAIQQLELVKAQLSPR
ncbi:hypothetical protein [Enterovibrio norvegicus]|uniref:Uncharacterized protein n=1 Tax=Enterovibrio norvegicus TaxID=188144 RepID=A0ABV4L552_9GAMM